MLKIHNNRNELWQWDLNQKLIVNDDDVIDITGIISTGNTTFFTK